MEHNQKQQANDVLRQETQRALDRATNSHQQATRRKAATMKALAAHLRAQGEATLPMAATHTLLEFLDQELSALDAAVSAPRGTLGVQSPIN